MSQLPSARSRRGLGCWWVVLVVVIGLAGYSLVRYVIDWNHYRHAVVAYRQADCPTAIARYDRILDGWRLADFGKWAAAAKYQKDECVRYQTILVLQESGNYSAAVAQFTGFVKSFNASPLAGFARQNVADLWSQEEPSVLAGEESCAALDTLTAQSLIPHPEENLPLFIFACARHNDNKGLFNVSFGLHKRLLLEYPAHPLAAESQEALLANPTACQEASALRQTAIGDLSGFIPTLYLNCARSYDAEERYIQAYKMYSAFLIEFPDHPLAGQAEKALLANSYTCTETQKLKAGPIAGRPNFMSECYLNCGRLFEQDGRYPQAITMYESFLADYPTHIKARDVERSLAHCIVEQSRLSSAGEIPPPSLSGSVEGAVTEVVIQNDSPDSLRIVFSGPEGRVEEMPACPSCQTYTGFGPPYCPERGPIRRYTLQPGAYDVVVESISSTGVTPWTGAWDLASGDEYSSCFFIVTTWY